MKKSNVAVNCNLIFLNDEPMAPLQSKTIVRDWDNLKNISLATFTTAQASFGFGTTLFSRNSSSDESLH